MHVGQDSTSRIDKVLCKYEIFFEILITSTRIAKNQWYLIKKKYSKSTWHIYNLNWVVVTVILIVRQIYLMHYRHNITYIYINFRAND